MPQNSFLFRLATAICLIFCFDVSTVLAEGSRNLHPSDIGNRSALDIQPGDRYMNRINRITFIYVYAEAGEWILLGSKNREDPAGGGDIYVYKPQFFGTPGDETIPASPDFSASTGPAIGTETGYSGGTLGTISTRDEELAGPNSADNTVTVPSGFGFAPAAYQAPETGIYGVVFNPSNTRGEATNGNPNGSINNPDLSTNSTNIWDVTVRADATSLDDLDGRVFTYAWLGFTGNGGRQIYSNLYYITSDGYRYQQDLRGMDPFGYALYANSLGFLDNDQPIYKNLVNQGGAPGYLVDDLLIGLSCQRAEYPIFFSDVTPGVNDAEINRVLNALKIPLAPSPPTVSAVSFNGNVGGATSNIGAGGAFHFSTTDTITYQIVISRDGSDFSPQTTTNATLTGIAGSGTHTVVWDGNDNAGNPFPGDDTGDTYTYRVFGRNAEIHFPMVDVENNADGGPTITRLNGPSAPDTTVYFDDRGYITNSGEAEGTLNVRLAGAPTPPVNLDGVDSTTSYRTFNATLGNNKALNLWTYYATTPLSSNLTILSASIDLATTVTAPSSAVAGSTVQGTFSFVNYGTDTADVDTYTMTLSPGLGTVNFQNLPTNVTANYDNTTGEVTFGGTGLPDTLASGEAWEGGTNSALPITFSYTAPATGSVKVTTGITSDPNTTPDDYPSNNTATVTTGIGDVDVAVEVFVPETAQAGDTVAGSFTFSNFGSDVAEDVDYSVTIGDPGNYPADVTFTSGLPIGVTATYDPSNGEVTFTGMPPTLASGQYLNFNFTYTAPASGEVPVNAEITTTTSDANSANNSVTDKTTIAQLGGTIFEDMDGDGIQACCETGIGGVTVELLDSTNTVIDTAVTALDGTYSFTNVPPGAYTLVETDPVGYVSTTANSVPINVPTDGSATVNFGDQPAATVSGTAFNDVNGDGIQGPGETGLSGVNIILVDDEGTVVGTTTTGAGGKYAFTGVLAGAYSVVEGELVGGLVVETDPTGYNSTTANTVPVSVGSGGSATANFGDQQQQTVSGEVFDDKNGNGFQDPGEASLPGVAIELVDSGGTVIDDTITASDGSYAFTGVADGTYVVRETDPAGYNSTTPNNVSVSVGTGSAAIANFGDQQQGTVSGTVFTDLNGNGTQDPGEPIIAGVTVAIRNASGIVIATTTTDLNGSYTFAGIAPGAYTVEETDPAGYASTTPNSVPVNVTTGGTASANFGDQRQGTVSGTVFNDLNDSGTQDPSEAGIGGVSVELLDAGGTVIDTTTTAGDGRYYFLNVGAGDYLVEETDPDGYISTTSNTVSVTVPSGGSGTANFGDKTIETLSGTVFTDTNGNGVQDPGEPGIGGVEVTLDDGTNTWTVTSAGDGSYVFTGVPTDTSLTVTEAVPAGYTATTPNPVSLTVPAGGSASVNFGNQQENAVFGVVFNDLNGNGVQDAGETGISGVLIELYESDGTTLVATYTSGDGTYNFPGIPDGNYIVRETDPAGYVSTTPNDVPVSIGAGGSPFANFGDIQSGQPSRRAIKFLNPVCTACNDPCPPYESFVSVEDSTTLDLGTTGTIEAWIQATSCTASDADAGIIVKGTSIGADAFGYGFGLSGGGADSVFGTGAASETAQNIGFRVGNNVLVATDNTIMPGKWYHVTGTWSPSGMALYINGILEASNAAGATDWAIGSGIILGRQTITTPEVQYYGVIEELRIWDDVRTETEIRANMCQTLALPATDLVCYLKYDEESGTVAVDASGSGNNADTSSAFQVCSEAPVGDASDYDYTDGNYAVALPDPPVPGTDTVAAAYEATPGAWSAALKSGIHLYRINDVPEPANNPLGMRLFGDRGYWGVFVTGGDAPTYSVTYTYEAGGIGDEAIIDLMYRHGGCAPWVGLNVDAANRDTTANTLTEPGLSGTEFILGKDVDPRNTIDFDSSSNQHITVADAAISGDLDLTTYGAIEAWVNLASWQDNMGIVHKGNGTTDSYSLYMGTNAGANENRYVYFTIDAGGGTTLTLNSTSSLNLNTWYHVAGTWDATDATTTMALYINGIQEATSSTAITAQQSNNILYIGARPTGGFSYFDGMIDEVRVWNISASASMRNQALIRNTMCHKLAGTETDLGAYWRFDEETGSIYCPDYSGNGHTGTMQNFGADDSDAVRNARVCSSAPIGDNSTFDYNAGSSSVTLNPGVDPFTASATGAGWSAGEGIHAYYIDEAPVYPPDLWDDPDPPYSYQSPNGLTPPTGWASIDYYRYWGVFVTDPDTASAYDVVYNYSGNPRVPQSDETVIWLARRPEYCYDTWTDPGALVVQDTTADTLTYGNDSQNAAPSYGPPPAKENPEYVLGGEDDPLAITLASFTATSDSGCVAITWETATEIDTAGFYLWRSNQRLGDYTRIERFIASNAKMDTQGAVYRYEDCEVELSGGNRGYYYMLQEVTTDGENEDQMHGPIGPVSENLTAAQGTAKDSSGDKSCFIEVLKW